MGTSAPRLEQVKQHGKITSKTKQPPPESRKPMQAVHRCRICGLLAKRGLDIIHHHQQCHNRPKAMALRGEAMYEPQRIYRREFAGLPCSGHGSPGAAFSGSSVHEQFLRLTFSAAGARPASLDCLAAIVRFLAQLIKYVDFAGTQSARFGASPGDWLRAVEVFSGGVP